MGEKTTTQKQLSNDPPHRIIAPKQAKQTQKPTDNSDQQRRRSRPKRERRHQSDNNPSSNANTNATRDVIVADPAWVSKDAVARSAVQDAGSESSTPLDALADEKRANSNY